MLPLNIEQIRLHKNTQIVQCQGIVTAVNRTSIFMFTEMFGMQYTRTSDSFFLLNLF